MGGDNANLNLYLDTLDGTNGFRLDGISSGDQSGTSVSSAGDVNGDGFDDIMVGAQLGDPIGTDAGETYVVFGGEYGVKGWANSNSTSLDLNTLNGSNGFRLNGFNHYDFSGCSVSSIGDMNGDGFDDILIGAYGRDQTVYFDNVGTLFNDKAGGSYVVFGGEYGVKGWANSNSTSLDLRTLNGSNGFRLDGIISYSGEGDESGTSVSSAGDMNGDGFDDILIGAPKADPSYYDSSSNTTIEISDAGETYVIFGGEYGVKGWANSDSTSLDLNTLNGSNGFKLDGISSDDLRN